MFYLYFCLFSAAVLGAYFVCKFFVKTNKEAFGKAINTALKVLSVIFCSVSFFSILLPDAFTLSLSDEELGALEGATRAYAFIRWFYGLSFIMLPLAVFFKNRTVRNIAVYFCTAMTVISLTVYPQTLEFFTEGGKGLNSISVFSEEFKSFMLNPVFRSLILGFTYALGLIIPVVLAVEEKHVFDFKNRKEYASLLLVLISSLCISVPIYVPQHIVGGYSDALFCAFGPLHIAWIAFTLSLIAALFFILRKKSEEIKRISLFVLSLSLVNQYFQMFGAISIDIKRMPFQLCNIGSFLILFSLITKSKKLFDFTVIVNVVGVLFALAVPDLAGEGLFYLYNMHFIFEHTGVIVIPVLALLLNQFPRLDRKSIKHFLLGFSAYFGFVWVLGTLFNGIAVQTGNAFWKANYMFMFDQATAGNFLPFLGTLFDAKIDLGIFSVYPVIQITVFTVFTALCMLVFGLIRLVYFIKDKAGKTSINSGVKSSEP